MDMQVEPPPLSLTVMLEHERAEMPFGAILWDMDGVLIDSLALIRRRLSEWAERHRLEPESVITFSPGRMFADVVREFLPSADVDDELRWCAERDAVDLDGIGPSPGACELLATLDNSQWAVVTSTPRAVTFARLAATGIAAPAVVVTADDVARGKPAPHCYLLAASRLGVPPDACVVIEDAQAGVEAGRAAGCHVIAVGGVHAEPWAGADFIVPNLLSLAISTEEP